MTWEPSTSTALNPVEKPSQFYPTPFISCALPYAPTDARKWERGVGLYRMTVTPGAVRLADGSTEVVLPSGKIARAALLYLSTQAKKTGNRRVELSRNYRELMRDLGVPWDSKTARKAEQQLRAVLAMSVNFSAIETQQNGKTRVVERSFKVGSQSEIYLDIDGTFDKEQHSYAVLSEDFLEYMVSMHLMPVEPTEWQRILKETKSPLAIDIYLWLTGRLPYLNRDIYIPWSQLYEQFGSRAQRMDNFKSVFRTALETALTHYPNAQVTEIGTGAGKRSGFRGIKLSRSAGILREVPIT